MAPATTNLLINHPRYELLKEEFLGFVGKPHLKLEDVSVSSGQRALWRCSGCKNEWVSAIAKRAHLSSGCTPCATLRSAKQQITSRGVPTNFPLIEQAIKVIKHPDLKPSELSNGSNLVVQWQCRCGRNFNQKMSSITTTNKQVLCNGCKRSQSSRFEYEVLEILQVAFPEVSIRSQYSKESFPKIVDLYIEDFDLVIELDPFRFHEGKEESDLRILLALRENYKHAIRVRDTRLGVVDDSIMVGQHKGWTNNLSPVAWSQALITWISNTFKLNEPTVTEEEIDVALRKANATWESMLGHVDNPASEESFAKEFVRNLTHPGKTLKFTSRTTNDVCEWECPRCNYVYSNRVARRFDGIGCPKHKGEKISQGRAKAKALRNNLPIV